jgi:hypothetical protein
MQPQERQGIEETRAGAEEALGPEGFAAVFDAGAFAPDEVVRRALEEPTSTLSE